MFLDTPATIAILGGGPIGIEVALYARFLGYNVTIFERGELFERLKSWKRLPLPSPFADQHSSLGLAALTAHDENYQPPANDAVLTHEQWIADYLEPLANTDLIVDHVRSQTEVMSVKRAELDPAEIEDAAEDDEGTEESDELDDEPEGDWEDESQPGIRFAVTFLDKATAQQQSELFDAVIDATGAELRLVQPNDDESGETLVDPLQVQAMQQDSNGKLCVAFGSDESKLIPVEQSIDRQLDSQLTVSRCEDSNALSAMTGWLEQPSDAIVQHATSATLESLQTGEPNFFVIGSKSFGSHAALRYAVGLQQIRIVFSDLGGRADLDLYRNFAKAQQG